MIDREKIDKKEECYHKLSDLEDKSQCSHCNVKDQGIIIEDYTRMHDRKVLIECGACDKLCKIYYKFDEIAKLTEKN
jgi:hypothetical protein